MNLIMLSHFRSFIPSAVHLDLKEKTLQPTTSLTNFLTNCALMWTHF
ncbi:MAG: hypothetical protein ACTS44_01440 [Candidatus Hodgkinia cicadicola]